MAELKWEEIPNNHQTILCRAQVFGGWLVKQIEDVLTPQYQGYPEPTQMSGYQWRSSITFVPDPKHEWKLD